ncbi:MAG TPA: hypothetical protein PKM63_22035 [Panacibacter sp.]|nr:hypothetical protein [Panacibacter sp.]HNP46994.1 hypothetical protein [Panacibacter sp.]
MEYEKEIDVNPDQTLHRIKSLMEKQNERNLNWIRVLNLSDLVNAKSREFFKIVSEVEETTTRHHSIFDDSRLEDLKKFIAPNDKVFFACGVNGNSNDWVENSKCKINRIGAIVLNKTNKYYHPLVRPNKKDIVDWRDQIREVLKST